MSQMQHNMRKCFKMAYQHKTTQTKTMLLNSLLDLMVNKELEDITVRDITEYAGVNRGTFYRHFKDKMDLVEQKERQIFQDLKQVELDIKVFADTANIVISSENVCKLTTYLYTQRRFLANLLGSNGDMTFEHQLLTWLYSTIIDNLASAGLDVTQKHLKIVVHYQVSAMLGVIRYWFIEDHGVTSPETIAQIIYKLNHDGVWRNFENRPL